MIRLYCIEDRIFSGFLYTVDPKTGNYVLFSQMNGKYQPTIVRCEVVERVEVSSDLQNVMSVLYFPTSF